MTLGPDVDAASQEMHLDRNVSNPQMGSSSPLGDKLIGRSAKLQGPGQGLAIHRMALRYVALDVEDCVAFNPGGRKAGRHHPCEHSCELIRR